MRRTAALLLLALCLLLAGCSHGHESPGFEKGNYRTHFSEKARESIEYLPSADTGKSKGAREIAIWNVDDIEARFYYSRSDDHVGFISLIAYDKHGEECRIDDNTCEEVSIEWRQNSDGSVWVDGVYFHGEEGTYIFDASEEAQIWK